MHTVKHQWLGITLGLLAIMIALGTPAVAMETAQTVSRKLITGKQIKDGSLQAKDLSKKARVSLRGKTGPRGLPGIQGPPGPIEGVTAGGDLSGTYPSPQLAADSVGIPEIGVIPAVRIVGSAPDVPDTTVTTVNWGSGQSFETVASMYDPAEGTKMVAPVSGLYLAHASLGFDGEGAAATGVRTVAIAINGSNSNPACFDRRAAASATLATFVNATCVVQLNAGQFVTATVTQTSGVALGFNGFESASLTWIGSLS
jgi:hypothetical protein